MYNFLYLLLFLVLAPVIKIKSIKKGYDFSIRERLVLYKDDLKNCIWIHCASVGELNTAEPIYNHFSKTHNVLITVSSPRGKKYAVKKYPDAKIRELPFDFSFAVKRFLNMYKPQKLIIVEEELWYNLVRVSSKKIPVYLINGRISPKSFEFYRKFSFFFRKIIKNFHKILAKSKEDADRFLSLCKDANVKVCGDLKIVSSSIKKSVDLKIPQGKKVLVAGSTYEKEENIILDVISELNDFLVIIAPRHLERLESVKENLRKRKINFVLFSERKKVDENTQVLLVDTMGVLSSLYRYADVAFIGGTIEDIGGHNPLEAIVEGVPVIIGENYYKIKPLFEEYKEFFQIVKSKQEFKNAVLSSKKGFNFDIKSKVDNILKCYIKELDGRKNEHNT